MDASGGNITITLYAAATANAGGRTRNHYIKRIDSSSNTVTFAMNGSETLEFQTTDQLVNQGSWRHIYSDGSNWFYS